MLQYRKITLKNERIIVEPDMIPDYMREEIKTDTNKMINEKKQAIENLLKISVKVFGTD
jgi:hypothetical protein